MSSKPNYLGRVSKKLLDILRCGEWVKTADLADMLLNDASYITQMVRRLKAQGYPIESDVAGMHSRGARMVPLPGHDWLPVSHVPDFIRMTRAQGFTEAEARQIILDDLATIERRSAQRAA